MSKKHLLLFIGAICIIGLGVATPQPASSATCLRTATPLTAAIATGPIPISMGLKFFPVSNQSPFVTGMRIRVVVGGNTKITRFVEGRVGSITNCNIALLVDRISGTGTMWFFGSERGVRAG